MRRRYGRLGCIASLLGCLMTMGSAAEKGSFALYQHIAVLSANGMREGVSEGRAVKRDKNLGSENQPKINFLSTATTANCTGFLCTLWGCTDGAECTNYAECTDGSLCTTGDCTRSECTSEAKCTKGDNCTKAVECTTGKWCTGNGGNSYCTRGQYCTGGSACTWSDACTSSDGCTAGTHCTEAQECTAGSSCTESRGCTKGFGLGMGCTTSQRCTNGQKCTAGYNCTLQACSIRGQCTAGPACSSGYNCTVAVKCSAASTSLCSVKSGSSNCYRHKSIVSVERRSVDFSYHLLPWLSAILGLLLCRFREAV